MSRLAPAGNRTGSAGRSVRSIVIMLTVLSRDIVVLRLLNYSCVLELSPSGRVLLTPGQKALVQRDPERFGTWRRKGV